MSVENVSLTLKQLRFGFQSGVNQIEQEEDGIVSVSYEIRDTAIATFEIASSGLETTCQFSIHVTLDERGVDGAAARARVEAQRFLERVATAAADF